MPSLPLSKETNIPPSPFSPKAETSWRRSKTRIETGCSSWTSPPIQLLGNGTRLREQRSQERFYAGSLEQDGSARSNKIFAAYQTQYLKATQFAFQIASASRHLASSSGSGHGTGSPRNSGSTLPNPAFKTHQKKAAKDKARASGKLAVAREKEPPAGAKHRGRKEKRGGNNEVQRRFKDVVSPCFDCTRHNVRRD
jgi:hypothetical protein